MVSWISALPRKRPARLQESAGRGDGQQEVGEEPPKGLLGG